MTQCVTLKSNKTDDDVEIDLTYSSFSRDLHSKSNKTFDIMAEEEYGVKCSLQIVLSGGKKTIGAAVLRRSTELREVSGNEQDLANLTDNGWSIDIYEFLDNEHLSNLDSFLVQVGSCSLYVIDELRDAGKGLGKKFHNLLQNRDATVDFAKKSTHFRKGEVAGQLEKLTGGRRAHVLNVAETERPLGYACIDCLVQKLRLLLEDDDLGKYSLTLGDLNRYMKLDSAASEAVNLLPQPDHPNQYGSIFGVLNRCRTKLGPRTLERWLRQPLLDVSAINERLDLVELLKDSTVLRNTLVDGPLKGVPDLETIVGKMTRRTAGLAEILRLYMFARAIPGCVMALTQLCAPQVDEEDEGPERVKRDAQRDLLRRKYLAPLERIVDKFSLLCKMVETVVDFSALPDLMVSARHSPQLQELSAQREKILKKIRRLHESAMSDWANGDLKLDRNPHHGYIFRATRADDVRRFQERNKNLVVLSILKNGAHITTNELMELADDLKSLDSEYRDAQHELVSKAVETSLTYLPLAESCASLVSELDVLCSFATTAAMAPGEYTRPIIHPLTRPSKDGEGGETEQQEQKQEQERKLVLKRARHPCVELMDDVEFIPNDYEMVEADSRFTIVTGPNMGGKSTYIRGLGALVVMAQVGSFVPCEYAEISVVDSVLARVGAGDAVQKGVSTFMAEMLEASVILHTATKDSLIIIDELGRGTSTFDGFGIAWAISDFIVTQLKSRCLFATHFHELTSIEKQHACVTNRHVSAHTDATTGNVVMLYDVRPGPCLESFGIPVAKMAGFPTEVVSEAKRKIEELEADMAGRPMDEAKRIKIASAIKEFVQAEVSGMAASGVKSFLGQPHMFSAH